MGQPPSSHCFRCRVTDELPTSINSAARGTGGLDPRVRAITTSEASPVPILQQNIIDKISNSGIKIDIINLRVFSYPL